MGEKRLDERGRCGEITTGCSIPRNVSPRSVRADGTHAKVRIKLAPVEEEEVAK
jgi:hypothetical protein